MDNHETENSNPSPTISTTAKTESEFPQLDLRSIMSKVHSRYPGQVGIAISDGRTDQEAGATDAVPAWSTSKVPLAIAALRKDPSLKDTVTAAITRSDNSSAEKLWSALGTPQSAATAVSQVLSEGGVTAQVQSSVVRPGFSSFGQTMLSPVQEAHFAANLHCIQGAETVIGLMGQVESDQAYGMGTLAGAKFKGGWGATPEGGYEARQFGTVEVAGSPVALALWVRPDAGDYGTAQQALNLLAKELEPVLQQAPRVSQKC
ncbi:serine hydrolase [Corynebacterium poyangense]|uniref:hypothetical protein n=1 Tax=Corynebacterium poyangense TaxID=2684405 RepID=UPI001CCB88AB|nr:hypothetical protein [Corynebacterium poyangense]